MRRILYTTLLTFCCIAPSLPAHADNYVKILAVLTTLETFDDAYAAGFGWGRDFHRQVPNMSGEVEFYKGFSKLKSSDGIQTSFFKIGAFTAFTYLVDPRIQLKGKIGLRYAGFESTGTKSGNDFNLGADFGIGALFALDRTRRVCVEYITSDENNFSQLAAGVQLSF